MDYKERYEIALEGIQEILNSGEDSIKMSRLQLRLQGIFPELRESEDEKTERILHSISSKISFHLCDIFTEEEFQCFDAWSNAWFKKQGKQKPFDYENANIPQKDFAPKEEPKFKVGDWIIRSDERFKHNTYLVTEVNDYYVCKELKGRRVTFTFNDAHRNFKLWDISDAKDGDVLCSNQLIILFKQWENNTDYCFVIAHAGIDISGELQITNEHWLISNNTKPATKEQRDTLMKAMTDAGYIFDFEKKELKLLITNGGDFDEKNCEQKHSIDINKMVDDYANNKEPGNEIFGRPVPCMVRAYRQGLNDAIGKVVLKFAWNEEDECYMSECIGAIATMVGWSFEEKAKTKHWLKSLKERIKNA